MAVYRVERTRDYTVMDHHKGGGSFETLAAAFSIGYQAGRKKVRKK